MLKSLLKQTPVTHPDFKALKTALKNVEEITIVLDRGTKDAEVFFFFFSEFILNPFIIAHSYDFYGYSYLQLTKSLLFTNQKTNKRYLMKF